MNSPKPADSNTSEKSWNKDSKKTDQPVDSKAKETPQDPMHDPLDPDKKLDTPER